MSRCGNYRNPIQDVAVPIKYPVCCFKYYPFVIGTFMYFQRRSCILQFFSLDVKYCILKQMVVPCMVPVQMCQDHIRHSIRIYPCRPKCNFWILFLRTSIGHISSIRRCAACINQYVSLAVRHIPYNKRKFTTDIFPLHIYHIRLRPYYGPYMYGINSVHRFRTHKLHLP